MDIFEKQQRIDSVKGIVKARWFNATIVVSLGIILKLGFFGHWGGPLSYSKILGMAALAFGYNFVYWLYIRRPAEKIGNISLNIVTALQVIVDQMMYTILYYYSGTVEGVTFLLYYLTILIASSLYKTKGIVLSGFLSILLYTGATLADFYRIVPHVYSYAGKIGWFGDAFMTRAKIVSFIFYMGVAIFFSAFLSNLIRKREEALKSKQNQLAEQSHILVGQTQELTKTKDYLHEALTKSDAARVETEKTKDQLQKANLELTAKIRELEKYGQVTTGRELKMMELKEKIRSMEERIKELEQQINKRQ